MPTVFIFEFVAGGGWQTHFATPPPASLLREGWAMLAAIVEDVSRAGMRVVTTVDDSLHPRGKRDKPPTHYPAISDRDLWSITASPAVDWIRVSPGDNVRELLHKSCSGSDWAWIVAPEFNGLLEDYCRLAQAERSASLNAPLPVIRLASDKHDTAEFLKRRGIPTPRGIAIPNRACDALPREFQFPAVLKPRFGAGSRHVQLVLSAEQIKQAIGGQRGDWRLEEFCPGMAASVSFLCGPRGNFALPPCEQMLSDDGRFAYLGGKFPLPPVRAERATALAKRAIDAIGPACGYLGVDLVLGASEDGAQDRVIEINPRLTTSYVGLRRRCRTNLAAATIAVAGGHAADIAFDDQPIQFHADGSLHAPTLRAIHP